jgi:hypothetical protein
MDVLKELQEIGDLIGSANLITAIRREVVKVKKDGIVVTDGSHHENGSEWEAVVRTRDDIDQVARRIRAGIEDVEVEVIAEHLLGIKTSRRGRYGSRR